MYNRKLKAGVDFPPIEVPDREGHVRDIAQPTGDCDWTMVVVYRGEHCPICTRFLNELEPYQDDLEEIGIDLVAVSADSAEQLERHREKLNVTFPLHHGLTVEQMKTLSVYISDPRSPEETDHPFAEPGLFVVNEHGTLQVAEISNNPFIRPDLETIVSGLQFIRDPENNYPIRGTHTYE